jgi:hypothetical protein
MTAEQNTPRPKETAIHKGKEMLHSGPDVHAAAAHGLPNLEPDTDTGGDLLAGAGNKPSLGGGTASGTGAVVEVVKPGESAPAGTPASGASSEDVNSTTGSDASSGTSATPAAASDAAPAAGTAAAPPTTTATPATGAAATADGTQGSSGTDSSANSGSSKEDNTQATSSDSSQNQNQNGKESSSKKKGLRKLLPW